MRWAWLVTAAIVWLGLDQAPSGGVQVASEVGQFQAATALAIRVTDWAFAIAGATILILIGTSYRRPKSRFTRSMFLLFLPAWLSLAAAIYFGVRVQQVELAFLFGREFVGRHDALRQIAGADAQRTFTCFLWGIGLLSVWLVAYLMWWIYGKELDVPE